MLKEGESETIADYTKRFVYDPKSPSANKVNNPLYFINHTTYLKVVGKV